MPLPDAVHHDARGQRVPGVGQPLRQFTASTALRDGRLVVTGQDGGKLLGGEFALAFRIAAQEQRCSTGSPSPTAQASGGSGGEESFNCFSSALSC